MNHGLSEANNQIDAELVAHCLAGERAAFGRLVTRHWQRVGRVVCRYLPTAFEADDVAQEAFLQAYLSLAKLREPRHFGAWVCGIAVNQARLRLRSQKVLVNLDEWKCGDEVSAENIVIQHEQLQQLDAAIDQLPMGERNAIWHVYRDGMSLRETAAKLDISLSAAKVRVHRGRKRLRQTLTEHKSMIPVKIHNIVYWTVFVKEGAETDMEPAWFSLRTPNGGTRAGQAISIDEAAKRIKASHTPIGEKNPNQDKLLQHPERSVSVGLREQNSQRCLRIFISPIEGDPMTLKLAKVNLDITPLRPSSFALMESIIKAGGIQIKHLIVSSLQDRVFFGTLVIESNGKLIEIDCRPSDGLMLSAQMGFPLFVAPEVMDKHSLLLDENGLYRNTPRH